MKSIEDRIADAARKHGANVRNIRNNISNPPPREQVEAVLAKLGLAKPVEAKPQGKTLATFRDAHDYAKRVREAIGVHCRGDEYVTEAELRQVAEVPPNLWRRYADLPEFEANRFNYKGVTYWGRAATIKAMRDIVKGI